MGMVPGFAAADAIWPVAIVAGVIVLIVIIFRQVRKRGEAKALVKVSAETGDRNDEAAEIMAEPTGDASAWSKRMRGDDSD